MFANGMYVNPLYGDRRPGLESCSQFKSTITEKTEREKVHTLKGSKQRPLDYKMCSQPQSNLFECIWVLQLVALNYTAKSLWLLSH